MYFDEMAQRIILDAKREMYELKHPYVGSEHLLLAILSHNELDITKTLNTYGILYDSFKKELIHIVGVGSKANEWFLFTPLLKKIIHHASYYSKEKNKSISPYSLVIAIFQEGDGVANRILTGMDIDIDVLQEKILGNTLEEHSNDLVLLKELGINMNERSISNLYDPVIGREKEIKQILQNLLRKNKNNPLLIGEAGVGKTAIVEELARRITFGNVPLALKDKIIYSVSMSTLVAGTKYRGEFEERVHKIIEEVISNPNIILFIDEIHTIMGAGGAEGAIDASNIVKPYLARGDLRIIGATTIKEYHDTIHKDKALCRRFQKILIPEATFSEVLTIIKGLKSIYEKFHNVVWEESVLQKLVELSFQCLLVGRQPDKTIDFLDEVSSYVSLTHNKKNHNLVILNQKIKEVEKLKNNHIQKHDFQNAMIFRKKEKSLKSIYNRQLFESEDFSKTNVLEKDLYDVIYQKVGIYNRSEWEKNIKILNHSLKKKIFGQDRVIKEVIELLRKYDYISNKNCLTILLRGKKGVGKTFLVKNILEIFFRGVNIITIEMSEYKDNHMISKLIGTSPGYVGYDDTYLFQSIQENPFSIIFLENIDKASSSIMKQLLYSFTAGYITNSHSEKVLLSKCIVFMTCSIQNNGIGFMNNKMFSDSFSKIKHILSFDEISEKIIFKYLKSNCISEEYYQDVFSSDWKNQGFYAICDCFQKETV